MHNGKTMTIARAMVARNNYSVPVANENDSKGKNGTDHPVNGDDLDDYSEKLKTCSINPTSLETKKLTLAGMDAHLIFIQEHGSTLAQQKKIAKELREEGWILHATPPGPGVRNTGVGCLSRIGFTIIPWEAKTKEYADAYNLGKCAIYSLDIGRSRLNFATLYGATGGIERMESAQQTDYIMSVLMDELDQDPYTLTLVLGDLNADTQDIPTIQYCLDREGWTDLGSVASIWQGEDEQTTCFAPNAKVATRRDYMFSNPAMLPRICCYYVDQTDTFPVHQPIRTAITVPTLATERHILYKPKNAMELFEQLVDKQHKDEDELPEDTEKRGRHKIRQDLRDRLDGIMDGQIEQRQCRLQLAHKQRDTNIIWSLISSAAEAAFNELLDLKADDANFMTGRGKVTISVNDCYPKEVEDELSEPTDESTQLERIAKLYGEESSRLSHVAARMRKAVETNGNTHTEMNTRTMKRVQQASPYHDEEARNKIAVAAEAYVGKKDNTHPLLRDTATWFKDEADKYKNKAKQHYMRTINAKMSAVGGKATKEVGKRIDNRDIQPIKYLVRDNVGPKGQEAGTVTTDPKEIDAIIRRTWKNISDGPKLDTHKAAATFLAKYEKYIFKHEEVGVETVLSLPASSCRPSTA